MFGQPVVDHRQHRLALAQHPAIVESQHSEAEVVQLRGAPRIGLDRLRLEMLTAVEFDNEPRFDTSEVREEAADGMLAAELAAGELTIAQPLP